MRALLAGLLAASAAAAQTAPAGDVVGVGNFIHDVSNLNESLNFYHNVLGMELQRAPGAAAVPASLPFLNAPEVPRLYNAVGAQYRVLSALVPGSPMRAELVEFKDVDRRPVRPRIEDPGASIMVLTVRDLAPVLSRLKKKATEMGDGSKAVVVSDPDGFFVEVIQRNPAPATQAPPESNFVDVSFAFVVSDANRMAQVFHDALGFECETTAFGRDKHLPRVLGAAHVQVRKASALVPGTAFRVEFLEFKGKELKPVHSRLQDPGTGVLRLVVKDIGASVRKLEASGVKVASAGGGVVTLPSGGTNTIRAAITSAPDNLFIQVLQAPPAR